MAKNFVEKIPSADMGEAEQIRREAQFVQKISFALKNEEEMYVFVGIRDKEKGGIEGDAIINGVSKLLIAKSILFSLQLSNEELAEVVMSVLAIQD